MVFRRHLSPEGNALGLKETDRWEDVTAFKPDAAFICTPTHNHIEDALRCARSGMRLFIEKPLSDRMEGVDELTGLCARKKLTAYVAYCLRFHPVIEEVKRMLGGVKVIDGRVVCASLLHRWRPKAETPNYSFYRGQGGGVILDLSHEFDHIQYLVGPVVSITGDKGRKSSVTVDAEDYCDAQVQTANGARIKVHLDLFSEKETRCLDFETDRGRITADLLTGEINQAGTPPKRVAVDRDAFMRRQTQYFLDHIHDPGLMNNVSEAKTLLEHIVRFRDA